MSEHQGNSIFSSDQHPPTTPSIPPPTLNETHHTFPDAPFGTLNGYPSMYSLAPTAPRKSVFQTEYDCVGYQQANMARNGAMPVQEEWNEAGGHDQLGMISLAYAIEQQEIRDLLQIKGDPGNESAYSYLHASILDWTKKEAEPSTTTGSAITVVKEEVPDEFKDDVDGAECSRLKRQNTPDILFVWYNEKSRKNWPSTHIRIVTPLLDEDTDGRKPYRLTFSSGYQPGFSRLRCIMRIAQYNDLQVIENLGKGNLQVVIDWYRWWSEKQSWTRKKRHPLTWGGFYMTKRIYGRAMP